MDNLKATAHIVKHVLEEDKRTRNSDSFLYLKVLEYIAERSDCPDLKSLTVPPLPAEYEGIRLPAL
ncbi:MAG: hypothetical protein J6M47_02670 [Clostridia bacterium]|nr:hypothetical protein [Clostridia bacterium]